MCVLKMHTLISGSQFGGESFMVPAQATLTAQSDAPPDPRVAVYDPSQMSQLHPESTSPAMSTWYCAVIVPSEHVVDPNAPPQLSHSPHHAWHVPLLAVMAQVDVPLAQFVLVSVVQVNASLTSAAQSGLVAP